MNVGELLQSIGQSTLFIIAPTISIKTAAVEMQKYNVGALLVVNDDERMTGVITERSLRGVIAAGQNPISTKVGQVMTPIEKLITISRDTDVEDAKELMRDHGARYAPVVRNGDIPDGILSLSDLI